MTRILSAGALTTDDMHTGGEPVRIVTGGYPPIPGATILEKRAYVAERLDHLRKMLMWEPRGHRDMYGVIPVDPDIPGAALAVLFMHNEGYSTMCGHATIALGRWAIDTGRVAAVEPETRFTIQCPCGPVEVCVEIRHGRPGRVTFRSVPAFVLRGNAAVDVPGIGMVRYDLAYGGAFYAIADAGSLKTSVDAPASVLQQRAAVLCDAVRNQTEIKHPEEADLGFLYGAILTDGQDGASSPSTNVCIFADQQVDRSPTGSGVTARIAIAVANGLPFGTPPRRYRSITGAVFEGRPVEAVVCGDHPAVIVGVAGVSHWSGRSEFIHEADDEIGAGFLLD
jgi:trans-L-3-hydroxyproline dehydratase